MENTSVAIALSGLSFIMTAIWGEPLIRILNAWRIGKIIRQDGPDEHSAKMGTPTMGGFMILVPVTLITVLFNAVSIFGFNLLGRSVLLPLLTMWAYAVLGMIDDWEGIRGPRRGLGMRAITKFAIQIVFAVGIAIALRDILDVPQLIWFTSKEVINLGAFYIPIAVFIIVGMSNAVNFTDGLDGLAGLIAATAFAAYGFVAVMEGQVYLARFCFSLVGALFGFLWFNVHPARLFMGDTGSLALGATLGVVALMTGQWLIIPLLAVIPVSEALSVVIQVLYFKATGGKRFFRMAPLHHHFELIGWSETQVVQRFWLVSLVFTMLGMALVLVE
ncbi:MAG TPA: phospho-N-acetylmuramoyl-pentapeptide-transferase [Anaerolineaceae bacterium]|jgi:phospho-N-acetylmuramoyl-pentapeptide-transferase|nr:MAG: Phospho-N-acetylmuramoyl-pentapeptide-transferase [Anaerolineae bacterium 49_20]HAF48101.1 phospho-N-acetylmuramoyl-pentapeptide-transferase [Anaerolineaceae bacterium]